MDTIMTDLMIMMYESLVLLVQLHTAGVLAKKKHAISLVLVMYILSSF
jgi:hypothetical protein